MLWFLDEEILQVKVHKIPVQDKIYVQDSLVVSNNFVLKVLIYAQLEKTILHIGASVSFIINPELVSDIFHALSIIFASIYIFQSLIVHKSIQLNKKLSHNNIHE